MKGYSHTEKVRAASTEKRPIIGMGTKLFVLFAFLFLVLLFFIVRIGGLS